MTLGLSEKRRQTFRSRVFGNLVKVHISAGASTRHANYKNTLFFIKVNLNTFSLTSHTEETGNFLLRKALSIQNLLGTSHQARGALR